MPSNEGIPQCALEGTLSKMVDIELDRGYDSRLEDFPFMRDYKLNKKCDNRMEKKEMLHAGGGLRTTAESQLRYST